MRGRETVSAGGRAPPSIAAPGTRLSGALRRLEEALARDPGELAQRMRAFQGRFRVYSPMNRTLILLQRPDATFVAGRRRWRALGRSVRAGARAIRIVAPVFAAGEGGRPRRFTGVRVYDVADTEGAPFAVPEITPPPIGQEARVARLRGDLEAWVRRSGLRLEAGVLAVNRLALGATDGRVVWVRPDLGPVDRVAVLAHEIAHVRLHFTRRRRGADLLVDDGRAGRSRSVAELEAELTSFLLLSLAGVDVSAGAAAYLASWRATMTAVRRHAERAFLAATRTLRDCERRSYPRLGPGAEEGSPEP